ncbi:MAG TPA: CBS domain-containing protein [Bryobacteraceae bacterium]|nr:CBS domain-containing protein [Bryobacteraceae bacterium]
MKVRDVMVKDVKFCTPKTNLAEVAEIFWKAGVGALPVVEEGRVLGIVTDRDISIALGTRNAKAADVLVKDIVFPKVFYSQADDDIHVALGTLKAQKVRRLPVVDEKGALTGILCLDDIVLYAEEAVGELTYADVVGAMQAICEHPAVERILAIAK